MDNLDTPHHKHVPSIKKMKAGDANCDTHKVILGWIMDTVKGIITLPEHLLSQLVLELFRLRHDAKLRRESPNACRMWGLNRRLRAPVADHVD